MSVPHLGWRKGDSEGNGKERMKRRPAENRTHRKMRTMGGLQLFGQEPGSRRYHKNRTSVLQNALFHSSPRSYFFLSWTLCWFWKCLGNSHGQWRLLSHWGRPNLLLPHEQEIFILECKVLCETLDSQDCSTAISLLRQCDGMERILNCHRLNTTLNKLCDTVALNLSGPQCPQLQNGTPDSKILSSFKIAQDLIISFTCLKVLQCFDHHPHWA